MKLTRKELIERDNRIKRRLIKGWSIDEIAKSEGLKSPKELVWFDNSKEMLNI